MYFAAFPTTCRRVESLDPQGFGYAASAPLSFEMQNQVNHVSDQILHCLVRQACPGLQHARGAAFQGVVREFAWSVVSEPP